MITNDDPMEIPDFLKRNRDNSFVIPPTFELKIELPLSIEEEEKEAEEYIAPESTLTYQKFVPNVQFFIKEKASNIVGEIEGMIDDHLIAGQLIDLYKDWSLYDYLKSNDMARQIAQYIYDHFNPVLEELAMALDTDDEELKYAYRGYTDQQIQLMAQLLLKFTDDVELYIKNEKATRKINKKPKKYSVAKIVSGVLYLKNYDKFRLVSVDPSKVVGSQELWTFNTNNNVITVYRALDRGGLTFKGSKVMNWDDKNSFGKRVRPNKIEGKVKEILEGGKITLRKIFDDIKSDKLEPTRITKNTILLRVV